MWLIWVACLLISSPADPPSVILPAEIKADVGQFVTVAPKTNGKSVMYYPLDSGLSVFPSDQLADKRNTVVIALKQGRYRLLCYTALGDVASQPTVTTIVAGNPQPEPGPGPGPQPDPGPGPQPGPVTPSKIWVVVVEETEQAAANRGAIFGDSTLNSYMKSKGHHWRIVDKDVKGPDGLPPSDVKRFLDAAKSAPYPSVFFVDEHGKVRGRATIGHNDTASNLLGILQKLDGSK